MFPRGRKEVALPFPVLCLLVREWEDIPPRLEVVRPPSCYLPKEIHFFLQVGHDSLEAPNAPVLTIAHLHE